MKTRRATSLGHKWHRSRTPDLVTTRADDGAGDAVAVEGVAHLQAQAAARPVVDGVQARRRQGGASETRGRQNQTYLPRFSGRCTRPGATPPVRPTRPARLFGRTECHVKFNGTIGAHTIVFSVGGRGEWHCTVSVTLKHTHHRPNLHKRIDEMLHTDQVLMAHSREAQHMCRSTVAAYKRRTQHPQAQRQSGDTRARTPRRRAQLATR